MGIRTTGTHILLDMKIQYTKINPGGNVTAIVKGRFNKSQKININKKILKSDPEIEQVGFWYAPRVKGNDGRLEMAGGEFCGNALRSFGALLSQQNKKNLSRVESSGTKEVIEIRAKKNSSEIDMSLKGFKYINNKCTLPGIKYVFTTEKIDRDDAKKILKTSNLLKAKASGVIGYKKSNTGFSIKPIVWVKDVETFFEETACGSGTMAFAFSQYTQFKTKKLSIKQPSGAFFKTEIKSNSIKLSGPIRSIKDQEIDI